MGAPLPVRPKARNSTATAFPHIQKSLEFCWTHPLILPIVSAGSVSLATRRSPCPAFPGSRPSTPSPRGGSETGCMGAAPTIS